MTGRRRLSVLGAVLLASLTAAAGLPVAGASAAAPAEASTEDTQTADESADGQADQSEAQGGAQAQGDGAQAQNTATLAATNITRTTALLTITGHSNAWYWRGTAPAPPGPCSAAVAQGTTTYILSGLTPATAYTFKAYSDSACATEVTSDSTDADFITPGLVLSDYDMAVTEGSTATYTVKLATAPSSDVTVTAASATGRYPGLTVSPATLTFTSQNYSTAQTVTVAVAAASADYAWLALLTSIVHGATSSDTAYDGAAAANAVSIVDSTAPVLSVSSATATGATLSLSNRTAAWYYRGLATRGTWGACTAVGANTSSVALSSLAPGTHYTYGAYSDSSCSTELTAAHTRAQFATPGVMLSTSKLIAPEGSTATYGVSLATKPAGSVTVTVTKASGGDSDLTVDTDPNTADNQSTLTFTAANWDTPQTVTVAAADETATDAAYGKATFNHSATSGYTTTATSALTVTEGDHDVCPGTAAVGGVTVTTGRLVDDCNTLLAAKATLAGASTGIANWATTLDMASWTGIFKNNSGVTIMFLGYKGLSGSIPNTLGGLTGLTTLALNHNSLSGPIPAELGSLTGLTALALNHNSLSGPIPAELGNLTSLNVLTLSDNSLPGTMPAELGNLTDLTTLYLDNNRLSGPIPAELGRLTDLTYLRLHSNMLSGPIPPSLGNLGADNFAPLWELLLNDNALSGPIPWQLGRSNPDKLDLSFNALSGAIPTALANTLSLRYLLLSYNLLSGALPPQLGSLAGLQQLKLAWNNFSGPIPVQLGRLSQLTWLRLDGNHLSGPIPAELGDLEQLTSLDLAGNWLSGPIPAELGDLTALSRLWLDHNDLSGAIPTKLGSLSRLEELSLHSNNLSGSIPAELGSLSGLELLYFSYNRLTGCVPAGLLGFLSDDTTDVQSDGTTLAVCDGMVLSDAHPSVGENSTATYTVRLSTRPTADVTVAVAASSSGDSDITVSPASLTFTTVNWSTPQTVTLTAAADNDAADGTSTVTHTASSTDGDYSGLTATATATEDDDDVSLSALPLPDRARLEISNHSGAWKHKRTAPTPGTCSSHQVAAGTSYAEVTGLTPSTSYTFKAYSDSACATELASASFTTASGVRPLTPVVMAPEGTTASSPAHASFAVVLATAPTANVTVTVSGDSGGDSDLTFDTDKVTAGAQDTLTFTSQNWNMPKFVFVYAAEDDDTADGTKRLTLTATSTDSVYSGATATVDAIELDNDPALSAGAVTATSAVLSLANHSGSWYLKSGAACTAQGNDHTVHVTDLAPTTPHLYKAYSDSLCSSELTSDTSDAEFTTENLAVLTPAALSVAEGSSAAYTVALATQPTANVTLALAVTGDSDVTVSPASLTFTSQNWSTARRVTVRAAQDADGAHGTAAVTHVASSVDAAYDRKNIGAMVVTEADDDVGLNASDVTATTATLTLSNHTSAWYYQRTAPTVGSCIGAVPAGTATASLENLTPGLSYTYKAYSDSTCSTSLTGEANDADFVTPLATFSAQDVPAPEGGTATYTIALAAAPTDDVTVTLGVTGDSDLTVSSTTLTFTSTTYSTAQTVTVSAAQDDDRTAGTATITHTSASSDTTFSAKTLGTVTVTEADDDPTLAAEWISSSAATLRIANRTGTWHYKQAAPAEGSCSAEIAEGTATARLSGLNSGTSYVFKAYSDAGCATELTDDTSDARFTTPSASTSSPGGGTPGGSGGGGGGASSAKSIRVSGATRYSTATAAANLFVSLVEDASAAAGSRQQVDTMILASGQAFPDALAASALARTLRAPVVLTPKKRLDPAVQAFVTRNRITKVVIVGGPAAVSSNVEDAIKALPGIETVTRHAGPDRYATAALIAQAAGTPGNLCGSTTPTVIVTTGENYPDALVAGPLAYRGKHPIVLTASDRLPDATAEYLRTSGAKQAIVVGGPAAVSGAVIDAITALGLETSRVSGSDRADTSVQFARRFNAFSGPSCYRRDTVGLATGFAFPDALSAAALLGHYGAPLLLTSPTGVPQPLIDYAAAGRLQPDFDQPPIVTIGGRNAVPSNHPTKLLAALPR